MHEIAYLRELQGNRSQADFAALLGISQPMLSMVYQGSRRLGRDTIVRLIEMFPDQQDTIIAVFLSSESKN